MTAYPAIRDPGSIERLLTGIREVELPSEVNAEFLSEIGFRRDADVNLLELLEFLGFSREGQPSVLWDRSVGSDEAPVLLGMSVKAAYAKLFAVHPDAQDADGSALMDFFRKNADASDADAAYMILTFKVLSDIAVFPPSEPVTESVPEAAEPPPAEPKAEEPESPEEPEVPEHPEQPVTPTEPAGKTEMTETDSPSIRLSIHIDISGDTDPHVRELALRLLRLQLEMDGNC